MARTLGERCSDFVNKRTENDAFALWKWSLCALICFPDLVAIGNLAWVADNAFTNLQHMRYYEAGSYVIWGLIVVCIERVHE